MPLFITGELTEYYQAAQFEFAEFYKLCKELGAAKMIDISMATVQIWYTELIRTTHFSLAQIKDIAAGLMKKQLFGRIDYSDWIETEALFTMIEVKKRAEEMIKQYCADAIKLKDKPLLTPDEEIRVRTLAAYNIKLEREAKRRRAIREEEERQRESL